jgi:hypothetical protein
MSGDLRVARRLCWCMEMRRVRLFGRELRRGWSGRDVGFVSLVGLSDVEIPLSTLQTRDTGSVVLSDHCSLSLLWMYQPERRHSPHCMVY